MNRSDYEIDGPIASHLTVNKQTDGTYIAKASGLSQLGRSENEAINLLKQQIQEKVGNGTL